MLKPIARLFPSIDLPPGSGMPILALGLAGCITTLNGGAFLPVFPEIVAELQIDPESAAILATVHTLTSAIFTPGFGWLADRIGARIVLVAGLIAYAPFGLCPAFLSDVGALIAIRGLEGAAKGAILASGIAIILGYVSPSNRTQALGYGTALITLASIVTFVLGGLAGAETWRHAFFLYILALPIAAFAAWALRDATAVSDRGRSNISGPGLLSILTGRRFLALSAAILVSAGGGQAARIYGPVFLKNAFDLGPEGIGMMLAVMALGVIVSSTILAGRLAVCLGSPIAVTLGMVAMSGSMVLLLLSVSWSLAAFSFVLFGMGFGIVAPSLFDALSAEAPAAFRATVMAFGQAINSLGLFVTPLILGTVWANSGVAAVLLGIAGSLPLVAVFLFFGYRSAGK